MRLINCDIDNYCKINKSEIIVSQKKLFDQFNNFFVNKLEKLEFEREKKWNRDFSSIEAYIKSIEPNRLRFIEFLTSWDEPRCKLNPKIETIKRYRKFTLKRVFLNVRDGIRMDCLLLLPDTKEKIPGIVCQHGYNNSPEIACGFIKFGEEHYHSCGIKLAEEGFAVIAPHEVGGYDKSFKYIAGKENMQTYVARNHLNRKAIILGINLLGFEMYHLSRAVDFLETLPEVDKNRIGFTGISQGGQSALWFSAADTRIKATVCAAFFNHRMPKYVKSGGNRYVSYIDGDEEDKFFWAQMLEFSDWEIASFICPRAFMVQAGKKDKAVWWKIAKEEFRKVKRIYDKLNINDRAEFCLHNGGHEFVVSEVIRFIKKWLIIIK